MPRRQSAGTANGAQINGTVAPDGIADSSIPPSLADGSANTRIVQPGGKRIHPPGGGRTARPDRLSVRGGGRAAVIDHAVLQREGQWLPFVHQCHQALMCRITGGIHRPGQQQFISRMKPGGILSQGRCVNTDQLRNNHSSICLSQPVRFVGADFESVLPPPFIPRTGVSFFRAGGSAKKPGNSLCRLLSGFTSLCHPFVQPICQTGIGCLLLLTERAPLSVHGGA